MIKIVNKEVFLKDEISEESIIPVEKLLYAFITEDYSADKEITEWPFCLTIIHKENEGYVTTLLFFNTMKEAQQNFSILPMKMLKNGVIGVKR